MDQDDEWCRIDPSTLTLEQVAKAYVRTLAEFNEYSIGKPAPDYQLNFHNGGRLKVFFKDDKPVRYELHRVHIERRGEEIAVVPD